MLKSNDTQKSETNQDMTSKKPRRHWLKLSLAGIIGALIGGTTVGTLSHAHFGEGGWGHGRYCSYGHGWGQHRHGPVDAEKVSKRADAAVEWLSKHVDATEDQQLQIKEIVHQAVGEISQLIDQHRANRDEIANVLVQAEIDRSALEQLRSSELALAEQASIRLLDAIADAAEMLTPEQRIQLAELRQQFHR